MNRLVVVLTGVAALALGRAGAAEDLTRFVVPEMGTVNSGDLSNGNQYLTIGLPWGMNAWSVVTKPGHDEKWFYDYRGTMFHGFISVRQPSPWIGNYCGWTVMPVVGEPGETAEKRASWFSHRGETRRPHFYSVYLADFDMTAEIVPTCRAAELRLTCGRADAPGLVVDPYGNGKVALSEDRRKIVGQSVQNMNRRGKPVGMKHDFVLQLDRPAVRMKTLSDGSLYVGFEPVRRGEKVAVRMATSYISAEQAEENLKELGDGDFDRLAKDGARIWNEKLGRLRVESSNLDRLRTFYTCLWRSLQFPRVVWERTSDGRIVHWSPTDGKTHPGHYYGGTGFWDTFRALFPLLNWLYQDESAKMMAGLENCWKECGWLPEWSAPGPSDCMIGNNSASVVADAWIAGVRGDFDIRALYEALLHGANSEHPTISAVGRKYVKEYLAKGYVPRDGTEASVSRTLEYAYDDWCIARLGEALGRPKEEVDTYRRRAHNWRNVFDPKRRFVIGRHADGTFAEKFQPDAWGGDFREGCSYHWTWCVFHDVIGLQCAIGSPQDFERRIDEIFTLPPTADCTVYGKTIHEAREMQVANMGQYAHGNQPIQQLIYFYDWTDKPWVAGQRAREVMDRLYAPTPEGYCGDEDNGQTSAWYVWSAIGFYPVCPASGEYATGCPLFDRIDVTLAGGKTLAITAPGAEARKFPRAPVRRARVAELNKGGAFAYEARDTPILTPDGNIDWQATLSAVFQKDTSTEKCAYTETVLSRPRLTGVQLPSRDCTEDDFKTLREWGATLVRYQMTTDRGRPHDLGNPDRGYGVYDKWLAHKLDHLERDVMPWARKYGQKVVVDMHVTPGGYRDYNAEVEQYRDPRIREKFIATWQAIAARFKGNVDVIYGYDLINEPQQITKVAYGYWEMQYEAAKAVRAIDPVTPIVFEGNVSDDPQAYPYQRIVPMKDVIYQVHMYMPGDFTCQGIGGVDKAGKRPGWPNKAYGWDKECLRRLLKPVRDFQLRHNAKIYVGEFSATTWADGAETYMTELIELMTEYGWDWTYHAFREHPCWDVELEAPTKFSPFGDFRPNADTPRKRALIQGFQMKP